MPTFTYQARTESADEATGLIEAEDLKTAAIRLKTQGLYPLTITLQSPPASRTSRLHAASGRPLNASLLALVTRQLSQALHAGVPLVTALQLLADQPHRHLAPLAATLKDQILRGVALADAMTASGLFTPATIALVRAGEAGGALEEALRRIAELAERDAELLAKVRAALTYPIFVLSMGCLTLVTLLIVAVPQLAKTFQELGAPLPWITRVVLALSHLMTRLVVLWLPVGIITGWLLRRHPWGHPLRQRVVTTLRQLPGVRPVLTQADLARWTQTLGLLVGQGLTLTEALRYSAQVVTEPRHQRAVHRILHDVTEGLPLSQALRRAGLGDPFLHTVITVGEAQGDLANNLLQAAQAYTQQVDQAMKTVSSLIEPVMIVIVGLVVGGIVCAMLLPIFQMSTMIK